MLLFGALIKNLAVAGVSAFSDEGIVDELLISIAFLKSSLEQIRLLCVAMITWLLSELSILLTNLFMFVWLR